MNTDKTKLLVCDCPLTRLLSIALFAPWTRFLADPLGAEESQTCLIRHRRRRSLSAFIRVHPRPFCLSSVATTLVVVGFPAARGGYRAAGPRKRAPPGRAWQHAPAWARGLRSAGFGGRLRW